MFTSTTKPSKDLTGINFMKNLTLTPFTDDLRAYLDWLSDNYVINRLSDTPQLIGAPTIPLKNSKF